MNSIVTASAPLIHQAARSRGTLVKITDPDVGMDLGDLLPFVIVIGVVVILVALLVTRRKK